MPPRSACDRVYAATPCTPWPSSRAVRAEEADHLLVTGRVLVGETPHDASGTGLADLARLMAGQPLPGGHDRIVAGVARDAYPSPGPRRRNTEGAVARA